jgi:multiple antibiotic resistance protein
LGFEFFNNFFYQVVTLFVILDPVATVPVFLVVTAGLDRRRQLLVAFYALVVAFLVMLFFIIVGPGLLNALHIPMPSFQLAGSIVLLFGLRMVLGKVIEDAQGLPADTTPLQRAVFPLAIPGIAGAGAIMTVMLLTDYKTRSFSEQVATTSILVLCLALLFGVFTAAGVISRVLGKPGIEIVSRVFGLILASIAVTNMIAAIKLSFGLP